MKMYLLDDFNFNFVTIYMIPKMLVLLKIHLNYLKGSIFEYFLKEYNILFLKNICMSFKEEEN